MGFGKYNKEELEIVRKIKKTMDCRRNAYKRWHYYDMQLGILIKKLGGKYKQIIP